MNNEEKILQILSEMQTEQKQTNQRLGKLEQGQANLEEDIAFIRRSVAVIEIEHGRILSALHDGCLANTEKLEKQPELEERIENLETSMSAVRMTLKMQLMKAANDT